MQVSPYLIKIIIPQQLMMLYQDEKLVQEYLISSAKNGVGEIFGSEQTPRGWHYIRAKIGQDCPVNTVFIARRPTGEIYDPTLKVKFPERDWILTRILWLCGLEVGKNRRGQRDTMRRKIYIHGTPDEVEMGIPGSKGCIRMRNHELIELFDRVPVGTRVFIKE